jgi:hypothetical protein
MYLGVFLIAVGIVALSVQFGILDPAVAHLIWPVLAIFVGAWLLMSKRGGGSSWFGGMGK